MEALSGTSVHSDRPVCLNLRRQAPYQGGLNVQVQSSLCAEHKTRAKTRTIKPSITDISLKKALAIGAVPLLLLFGAAFQSPNSVPGQLQAILAKLTDLADKGPRKFYLTKTTHNGAQTLSACAPGYHMASLWEIHDTSNLRYNTDLGVTTGDSGFGPPTVIGWIRTGSQASDAPNTGDTNCNAWTSADFHAFGTQARPTGNWIDAGINISPWRAVGDLCGTTANVWCVQD